MNHGLSAYINHAMLIPIAGILFGLIGLTYYRDFKHPKRRIAPNTIINMPGTYQVEPSSVTIKVRAPRGLIEFEVIDKTGKTIIKNEDKASIYKQWHLLWDAGNRLWFYSADIGGKCFVPKENGKYEVVKWPGIEKGMPPQWGAPHWQNNPTRIPWIKIAT